MLNDAEQGSLEGLSPILETALDAVIVMRPDDTVADWNAVAEAVFGWSRDEALGRRLVELIIPPQHREGHLAGLQRFNRTGEKTILNRRVEITALHKSGREFPVELSVTSANVSSGRRLFVGFLRDITDRRTAEARLRRQAREARLLFDVTRLAAETDSFEQALEACLQAICRITGWPVGHAFLVHEGWTRQLVSTSVWHEASPGIASRLRASTDSIEFREGVGLPGMILRTGEPTWIPDAEMAENFARKGAGFGAAFGFPLTSEGRTIAIMEFFAETGAEPDADLLLTVRALGEQVGRVLERKRTEEHQRLMTKELNHRVRNTLAIVQSVARQSFADFAGEDYLQEFEHRLSALAGAHEALTNRNWEAASLDELVRNAIFVCGAEEDQVEIAGPEVWLPPKATVSFTMALHELCTNAVKYGAFSLPAGKVSICWNIVPAAGGERLHLEWRERDGPRVDPPTRRGFGTRMIERALARELAGDVELRFAPEGVECIVDAPVPETRLGA